MLMSPGESAATLIYGPNGFRVIRTGRFVTCAVSGQAISLQDLRYWSVERQEAYATPEIATRRLLGEA
ncbi:MAG: hypothetical protein B7Z08_07635 [Sphingomonadales bacterium 32-68-7]|nr:MAG: hypothetical protein B7Z33_01735 [Sphingomonadales bacterium 12-68-11]OYX08840.1 MAG: hypothetical protein B7Z08_07635 [Sphingomonadales bacterium 32-68-7]